MKDYGDFEEFFPLIVNTVDELPIEREDMDAYDPITGYQAVLFDDFVYRTNPKKRDSQFSALAMRALFDMAKDVTIPARYKDRWIAGGVMRAVTTKFDESDWDWMVRQTAMGCWAKPNQTKEEWMEENWKEDDPQWNLAKGTEMQNYIAINRRTQYFNGPVGKLYGWEFVFLRKEYGGLTFWISLV
jgi:hypothetical protein